MNNDKVSLSRYILVILCVSVVFTALILIILNSWVQNKRLSSSGGSGIPAIDQVLFGQSFEDGYKAGYLAARSKYQRMAPLPEGMPVMGLSGTVESINDKQLVVLADNLDVDEIVDGVSLKRTAMVDEQTKFLMRTPLSPEEQSRQIEAWSRNTGDVPPPLPYTEKTISLKDIKAGQNVSVTADEDIKLKESFSAKEVIVYQQPEIVVQPEPVPPPIEESAVEEEVPEDTGIELE